MSETKDGRCLTCGGGFFKKRPKGAVGPREVWQPCICTGLRKQIELRKQLERQNPAARQPTEGRDDA